jgi:coenzyme F420 hydrogenase subunit beta
MKIMGSTELNNDVQKKDLCVDCGACVGLCPYFISHKGKIARLFPCTLPEGRCYAHCPKTDVDLDGLSMSLFNQHYNGSAMGHYLAAHKAMAGKAVKDKGRFQNGGAVSALTAYALKTGVIHAAALTQRDGLIPRPVLVHTEEEVFTCSGSKYMASPTLSALNSGIMGRKDSIGIVGTPCQMTAVAQMRRNPLSRDDFYDPVGLTIGLFCTWAVDTRRFLDLLPSNLDHHGILSMDVPPPPAEIMEIKTKDGSVSIPLSDIRKAVPKGCSICPDMTAEFTDISVGALEGDKSWNTLIIRTKKGLDLIKNAVKDGYLVIEDIPAQNLAQLEKGAVGKKRRAFLKAREENSLVTDTETAHGAIVIDNTIVDRLLS